MPGLPMLSLWLASHEPGLMGGFVTRLSFSQRVPKPELWDSRVWSRLVTTMWCSPVDGGVGGDGGMLGGLHRPFVFACWGTDAFIAWLRCWAIGSVCGGAASLGSRVLSVVS